jgi:hypothetical protein
MISFFRIWQPIFYRGLNTRPTTDYSWTMEPISFSFEPSSLGTHTKVVVRCGPDGSRALCGELTMRTEEWYLLRWLLATTPPLDSTDLGWIPVFARDDRSNHRRWVPIDDTPVIVRPEKMASMYQERIEDLLQIARKDHVSDPG